METENNAQVATPQLPNLSKYLSINTTTIHIAIEVVIALIMFTYFNSKIGNLETKIKNTQSCNFEDRISELEKRLEKQDKIIAKLSGKHVTFQEEQRSNPLFDTISNIMNINAGTLGHDSSDDVEIREVDTEQLDEELKEELGEM